MMSVTDRQTHNYCAQCGPNITQSSKTDNASRTTYDALCFCRVVIKCDNASRRVGSFSGRLMDAHVVKPETRDHPSLRMRALAWPKAAGEVSDVAVRTRPEGD